MKTLAIDTALGKASVCIFNHSNEEYYLNCIEDYSMQAEKLFGIISKTLEESSLSYDDIDIFSSCIGPGSFTGVRIGVSAAKGLAFAKSKPFIGVTSLEALYEKTSKVKGEKISCAIDASREQVYFQCFPDGKASAIKYEDASKHVEGKLACNCYETLKNFVQQDVFHEKQNINYNALEIARASEKLRNDVSIDRNNPIYLRAPDAKESKIKRKVIFET